MLNGGNAKRPKATLCIIIPSSLTLPSPFGAMSGNGKNGEIIGPRPKNSKPWVMVGSHMYI